MNMKGVTNLHGTLLGLKDGDSESDTPMEVK